MARVFLSEYTFRLPVQGASLVKAKLARRVTRKRPTRIIADRGYDWRALWERLEKRGIDLIAPHLRTAEAPL